MSSIKETPWTPIYQICCCGDIITKPIKENTEWVCMKCDATWIIINKEKILKSRGTTSCFVCLYHDFRMYNIQPEEQVDYICRHCAQARKMYKYDQYLIKEQQEIKKKDRGSMLEFK